MIREYSSAGRAGPAANPGIRAGPAEAWADSLRDAEHLEERVAARLDRQVRLTGPDRPELWIVLDEAVLRRPVGGAAVMRGQSEKLLRMAEEPNVTLQALPFDEGAHGALPGSLTVLVMPDGTKIAYTEGAHHGRRDRGTGRGRTVRSDLRSTQGDGTTTTDVARPDPIRAGG
ncbi:hypothetical protein SBADM41S_08097 [Streptomyces badius]